MPSLLAGIRGRAVAGVEGPRVSLPSRASSPRGWRRPCGRPRGVVGRGFVGGVGVEPGVGPGFGVGAGVGRQGQAGVGGGGGEGVGEGVDLALAQVAVVAQVVPDAVPVHCDAGAGRGAGGDHRFDQVALAGAGGEPAQPGPVLVLGQVQEPAFVRAGRGLRVQLRHQPGRERRQLRGGELDGLAGEQAVDQVDPPPPHP